MELPSGARLKPSPAPVGPGEDHAADDAGRLIAPARVGDPRRDPPIQLRRRRTAVRGHVLRRGRPHLRHHHRCATTCWWSVVTAPTPRSSARWAPSGCGTGWMFCPRSGDRPHRRCGSGVGGPAAPVAPGPRAVVAQCTVLLDEPTEHLDADSADAILREVFTPWALFDADRTVVVATHHLPPDLGCPRLNVDPDRYPGCQSAASGLTGVLRHD